MTDISKPSSLNKIWGNSNVPSPPSDSKINNGWVTEIPTHEDFTWIDNRQDQAIAHINQHGIPQWDSITEYQANTSYTMGSDGIIYRCKVTNTNKNPVTDPATTTYWLQALKPVFDRYDLLLSTSTATLDLSTSQIFNVDASVPRTLTFTNVPSSTRTMVAVVHITGSSAITWPAGVSWDSNLAPVLGASWTIVTLVWVGSYWRGVVGAST